jgi:hypothetical protein
MNDRGLSLSPTDMLKGYLLANIDEGKRIAANGYAIHRLLARLTDYVETQSGQTSRYAEYVGDGPGRYEVEHILADHPERHTDEFAHPSDFAEHRNRIGGLLLLPRAV